MGKFYPGPAVVPPMLDARLDAQRPNSGKKSKYSKKQAQENNNRIHEENKNE